MFGPRLAVACSVLIGAATGCGDADGAHVQGGTTGGITTEDALGSTTSSTSSSSSSTSTSGDDDDGTTTGRGVCGDGRIDEDEACDDGNEEDGDGCDAACALEPGYACEGEPSTCASLCGNGIIDPTELCDDGNTDDEDGCSSDCSFEPGYVCSGGEPTQCAWTCGDGLVALGAETCDDMNDVPGDGCDACQTEPGWACAGAPSLCSASCGDGVVGLPAEACDDDNLDTHDGCSDTCQVEPGYVCAGEPSECTAPCGDGIVALGAELCDGTDVGGRTCAQEAFTGGLLVCDDACAGYDTSGCFVGGDSPTNAEDCGGGSVRCGIDDSSLHILECLTTTLPPPITVYEVNLTLSSNAGQVPFPSSAEIVVFGYTPGPPSAGPTIELAAEPAHPGQLAIGFIAHALGTPVVIPDDAQQFCVGIRSDSDFAVARSSNDNGQPTTFFLQGPCLDDGGGWRELSDFSIDGHMCADALVNGS